MVLQFLTQELQSAIINEEFSTLIVENAVDPLGELDENGPLSKEDEVRRINLELV